MATFIEMNSADMMKELAAEYALWRALSRPRYNEAVRVDVTAGLRRTEELENVIRAWYAKHARD